MDIHTRIKEVLEKGHLMSIGHVDESGVWVSDVIYVHDDEPLVLYWMSHPGTRRSKGIEKNPNVAGTITVSNTAGEKNLGIQFSGKAKRVDGARHDLAKKHFKKRGHPEPKEEDDVLDGDSWYMLIPEKIDLIDEANFGFDKKFLGL